MIWGLMRHCEAIRLTPEEVLGRHKDVGLTDQGKRQAIEKAGKSLGGAETMPRLILSSPRLRCLQTAHYLKLAWTGIADWLDERDYGGVMLEENIYPEGITWEDKLLNHHPGGTGETLGNVLDRVEYGMGGVDLDGALIISHEIVLKAILSIINNESFEDIINGIRWPEGRLVRVDQGLEGVSHG